MRGNSKSFLPSDLYQPVLIEAKAVKRETETAVFEFFVCNRPGWRNFFVATGLGRFLNVPERLKLPAQELTRLNRSVADLIAVRTALLMLAREVGIRMKTQT